MTKVGIDIGATNTRVAAVADDKVLEQQDFSTFVDSIDQEIDKVNEIVKGYEKKYGQIKSIGFACPGPLDLTKGEVLKAPNLTGWRFTSVTGAFKKKMPEYDFYLENDASTAGYGQWIQYGKPYSLFYVTVSTGVGGGFVDKGAIMHGYNGVATEIFNSMPQWEEGQDPSESGIEYFTSGKNIPKQLAKRGVNVKDSKEAFAMMDSNPIVKAYFEEYKKRMAGFLATAIYFYNPEYVVVGGGVAMHNQDFFKEIFALTEKITSNLDAKTKLVFAKDMENSILVAAANLDTVKDFL